MRRRDREITDINEIAEIMKQCDVCNVAFFDKEYPYIVPLNFGVEVKEEKVTLYFHGAKVGKKLELLKENPKVGFELNGAHHLILGEEDCNSTMEYKSVCGNGRMEIVAEEKKKEALSIIMKQYSPKKEFDFPENEIKMVQVLALEVHSITGKKLKVNS